MWTSLGAVTLPTTCSFGNKASDIIILEVSRLLKVWPWAASQSTLMLLHLEVGVKVIEKVTHQPALTYAYCGLNIIWTRNIQYLVLQVLFRETCSPIIELRTFCLDRRTSEN